MAQIPRRRTLSTQDYVRGVLDRDRAVLSRAITLIESGRAADRESAQDVLRGLLPAATLDASGIGLDGVPLTLVASSGETQATASSDAGGLFRFERVPDGSYELVVGHASSPILAERRALRFEAPWMDLPDIQLPPLGEFVLEVVDPLEQPIEGVQVRGSGNAGGLIEETTDAAGRIRARARPCASCRRGCSRPIGPSSDRRRARPRDGRPA